LFINHNLFIEASASLLRFSVHTRSHLITQLECRKTTIEIQKNHQPRPNPFNEKSKTAALVARLC
jgi:hypothetical protein